MTTSTTNYRDKAAKVCLLICLLIMGAVISANSQNARQTPDGNFVQISASKSDTAGYKPTGKRFTTAKGETFPVMISSKGKLFVIRQSAKTGNKYRQYLKLN